LTAEITNENLNDFENNYGIVIHDLTKENLSVSTIKEILANNAKAAIQAEKLVKQIDALKSINEDFED
jgi:flagellar biosynthesis component FlhA